MGNSDMYFGADPSVFQKAKDLRNRMTLAEKILWRKLNKKQVNGCKFRRQHPISHFIADFYCHSAKLIIEVDGKIHEESEQKDYDSNRTFELSELGIKILRFTNEEVMYDAEKVVETIGSYLINIPKENV